MAWLHNPRAAAEKVLQRARDGDRVVLVAGVAAAAAALWFVAKAVLTKSDSPSVMNDDQKIVSSPRTVTVAGKTISVERIKPGAICGAADTLASSNRDDPIIVACGAESFDSARREASLRWLYRVLLNSSVPAAAGSISLQTEGAKAVAIWWSHGNELSLPSVALNGGWQALMWYSGWERRGRFLGYSELIRAVKRRHLAGHEGAFFYLLTHGRKAGLTADESAANLAAVVLPVLDRADALGQPCYVEITTSSDVPTFESFGFKPLDDTFSIFGTTVALLKRDARTA